MLDNIVWHSLTGAHAPLGQKQGAAARFLPDVSPFSAVDDLSSAQAWQDLGRLIGAGAVAMLFAPAVEVPDGWKREFAIPCLQMVATDVEAVPAKQAFSELGPQDVEDAIALTAATRPGPFDARTIELGRYIGLREGGRLVAMAGERFKAPGWCEISAVCTATDVRGRGLGRELVLEVLGGIRARGEEAFLHVLTDNTPAIALYTSMGLSVRTGAEAVLVRS